MSGWRGRSFDPSRLRAFGGASAIAMGDTHMLAIKIDGSVVTCGQNTYGQLGNGSAPGTVSYGPVPVSLLANVVAIAAGDSHSLALKGDGTVWKRQTCFPVSTS